MIKYKLYLKLLKNDMKGECCLRKTPASDKPQIFFFANQEKWWKLLVFWVFIALAYSFF